MAVRVEATRRAIRPRTKGAMLNASPASLEVYRDELARCRPLAVEEERELARRYQGGDRRAGDRLVEAALPFVVTIAREYRRWGVPLEDLIQQGNLGLLKAVERFDPDRGCRLITYAGYWIRAEIREYVVRGYRMVRLGTTRHERKALRVYRKTREDDPVALAAVTGLTAERAERLLPMLTARDLSLDQESPNGTTPLDRIASPDGTPEDRVLADDLRARMREVLDALLHDVTARERVIVRSRWLCEDPVTLEALGSKLGVSKERVRQLEERMARRLRERLLGLGDYAAAG